MRIIGVMSGSSLDGLDIAGVFFDEGSQFSWHLEYYETFPLPLSLKNELQTILDKNAVDIAITQSRYSKFVGECINVAKEKASKKIDFVSIHGHTVLHLPEMATSWQLLNGGAVASICASDVICDFRNGDMALGGQGTPMAVIADRDLFKGYDFYINLGGIANISYQKNGQWHAYDFAPCNQVNDYYAQKMGKDYDENGDYAKSGQLDERLLDELSNHPFVLKNHPKSLDNAWIKDNWIPFIDSFNLSIPEVLHTYTHFLIEVIKKEISFKEGMLFFTGGGTKNHYFTSMLKRELSSDYECIIPKNEIIDYKESILMAYMAYLRVKGHNNFISSATGANADTIGGAWYAYNL